MIQYWSYLREYKNLKKNILNSVDKIFQSGTLLLGDELKKFEKNFCKFNKSKYGLGVSNGTDALFIALKCLNIGKDDEVITVSNTAIPTAAAIINTGASVKFADIGKDYLIDVNKISTLIRKVSGLSSHSVYFYKWEFEYFHYVIEKLRYILQYFYIVLH